MNAGNLANTDEPDAPPSSAYGDAVATCLSRLRRLITNGTLSPGEQIRQAEMAERLHVSRVPLREALKVLESDGVVVHRSKQGYFVTKLGREEVAQLYVMRQLLESELLATIAWPDAADIAGLREVNGRMEDAISRRDVEGITEANQAFHFGIFRLSPLRLIRREVERLWLMSDSYRALYFMDDGVKSRIVGEHEEILRSLEQRDKDALRNAFDHHRMSVPGPVSEILQKLSS